MFMSILLERATDDATIPQNSEKGWLQPFKANTNLKLVQKGLNHEIA